MAKKTEDEKPIRFQSRGEMPPMPASSGTMRTNKTASWRSLRPVIIEEKCKRCMLCWKFCPEPSISPTDPPIIDYDFCKGCGICIVECPFDAIISEPEGR